MITQFDKATCKLLGREIDEALAAVAAKHGLTALPIGGNYDTMEFTAKVLFRLSASNPNLADAEQADFARYCRFFDLKPEHYGARLKLAKYGEVTLVGLLINRPKFPIKVRCEDGTVRIFDRTIISSLQPTPTA